MKKELLLSFFILKSFVCLGEQPFLTHVYQSIEESFFSTNENKVVLRIQIVLFDEGRQHNLSLQGQYGIDEEFSTAIVSDHSVCATRGSLQKVALDKMVFLGSIMFAGLGGNSRAVSLDNIQIGIRNGETLSIAGMRPNEEDLPQWEAFIYARWESGAMGGGLE